MDELLRLRLTRNAGTVTSAELARMGIDGGTVRRLIRTGALVRVRASAFVDGPSIREADAQARHHLTARAMLRTLNGYAASHLTALVLHGLPVLATDLGEVHVAQIGAGRARRAGALRVHPAVSQTLVVRRQGVGVVAPALAVAQTSHLSVRAGLVAADAAPRAGMATRHDLVCLAERAASRRVAALASPLSESPGESWTRLVLDGLGVDAEQQVEIRDADGRFVARVDFLVRGERLVIEFDGASKYAGADGRDALVKEKRREDGLRALGYRVVRLTWTDLHDPSRLSTLLQQRAA